MAAEPAAEADAAAFLGGRAPTLIVPASAPSGLAVRVTGHDGQSRDCRLRLADGDVTVGEVLAALELDASTAVLDGRPVAPLGTRRAADVLVTGTQLHAAGIGEQASSPLASSTTLVEVAVVAGLDAGAITELPAGHYRLGHRWFAAVDESQAAEPRPWHEHAPSIEAVMTPDAVLALGPPIDPEPGYPGYLHRPPRPLPALAPSPLELATVPKPVDDPPALSWATLLAPIPIAILMAVFFRPLFAIFAAMGPVIAIGRWLEGRRKYRKQTSARQAEIVRLRAEAAAAVTAQTEHEARLRWQNNPHVAELWKRARASSVRLWERRPTTAGHLVAMVGIGPDEFTPPVEGVVDEEVHGGLLEARQTRPVPHLVDLAMNSVGIWGDRRAALAVSRSLVLQLATLQGPSDLRIGIVCAPDRAQQWDWLKWLPHLEPAHVAHTAAPIAANLTPAPGAKPPPTFGPDPDLSRVDLVIVDLPDADVASIHRSALDADRPVRFIALGSTPTALPAVCASLLGAGAASLEITTPELTAGRREATPVGISAETATAWARALAASIDPEVGEFASNDDDGISLIDLVGFDSVEQLSARWRARPPDAPPCAAVGVGETGPFTIDISADGPHALVAGTTGSGKSEFLRTMVVALAAECPPEHLNFVLVDFKGGGAFDVCDRLPHIAGLITDLDESMVERAINSLRAELHRREHLFRALGASAYDEAVRLSDEPIARLLIVIDEFAALATDYAELMTSIIDLAARGRSLGMHLVLATQRPNGVVDQKIRANTNLRVALRVQDAFDSQDVIGVPDAAAIDRKSPGRAIFSVGGDAPITVQTAYSGAPDRRSLRCQVVPWALFDELADAGHPASAPESTCDAPDGAVTTEIEVLIDAISAAAGDHQARALWPEPLPESFDWIDLGTRMLSEAAASADAGLAPGLAFGLVDLPDQQAQRPWRWDPDRGALALYGSSASCIGRTLVSLGAAISSTHSPGESHLYVIDGDAGTSAPLAGLPHTGAYVTAVESDRIERTVAYFERNLHERRTRGADLDAAPRLFLFVDNLAAVTAGFDDMAAGAFAERLGALARDGTPQRIHLVITARTVRDISHRLGQHIAHRLTLALSDPAGYLTLGLKNRDVVPLPAMRAMDIDSRRVVQLVEPPQLDDLRPSRDFEDAAAPVAIGAFPTIVSRGELSPARSDGGRLVIPCGIEADHLGPAELVLQPAEHALIVSSPGAGRSTVLCTIAEQLASLDDPIDVVRIAPVGSPLRIDGVPGRLVDLAETVDSAGEGAPVIVLVDDAGRLDDDIVAALESVLAARPPGVRVIAACDPDFARSMRAWTNPIRSGGTGIVVGGSGTEGDLFKVKLSKLAGLGTVPGRGYVIVRGRVCGAQLAQPGTVIRPVTNATPGDTTAR